MTPTTPPSVQGHCLLRPHPSHLCLVGQDALARRGRWQPALRALASFWRDVCTDERTRFLSQATCAADFERRLRSWDDGQERRARLRLMF
jgi:hypothetical protein